MTEPTRKRERTLLAIEYLREGDGTWTLSSVKSQAEMNTLAEARLALKNYIERESFTDTARYRIVRILDEFDVSTEQRCKVTFK